MPAAGWVLALFYCCRCYLGINWRVVLDLRVKFKAAIIADENISTLFVILRKISGS
jgi:hypothetical protein